MNTTTDPSEGDEMTKDQEAKVDRLLASNTRIEANQRTLAAALKKVGEVVQADYETDLITLAEQRDKP